ncbi:haloacid dehalogenase type II [Hoyosella sp. YIM 151337]|uniref:haloacid dehalogenase type II n=1 Tax=Hoyosella sp. YIM 151337 TaxID=2992742 RepID=UPI00223544E6|nr:haloacid dehalogenase type II [Hoyosella sp. YIM 151337]MCW4351851.1 haloacid dehalogenase type II [Hoyosella sp. YIM 151337]
MKALMFDVQGTATDFYTPVLSALEEASGGRSPETDWGAFVNEWRSMYFEAVDDIQQSRDDWVSVHAVYRAALDELLMAYSITIFSDEECEKLAGAWQTLTPWDDVVPGIRRLNERFVTATLSNADVSAVVRISRSGGIPWNVIFAAEMFGTFKPHPRIYLEAARFLGLPPKDIMMVASHKYDIRAAAALGFRTAFVARPHEYGPSVHADTKFEDEFDINARDFLDLADQLDCPPLPNSSV